MLAAVESAASVYSQHGRRYFEAACSGLAALTPQSLASGDYDLQGFGSTKVRFCLAMARIRKLEGREDESRAFAAYALGQLGSAAALKHELQALAA